MSGRVRCRMVRPVFYAQAVGANVYGSHLIEAAGRLRDCTHVQDVLIATDTVMTPTNGDPLAKAVTTRIKVILTDGSAYVLSVDESNQPLSIIADETYMCGYFAFAKCQTDCDDPDWCRHPESGRAAVNLKYVADAFNDILHSVVR